MKKITIFQLVVVIFLAKNSITQANNEEKVTTPNRIYLKNEVNVKLDGKILKESNLSLDGKILKAYNVAFKKFKQENFNLINYDVVFEQDNKTIIISFVPIPKDNEWEEMAGGGRNSSGEEINYRVSLDSYKIIEIWGGR